MVWGSRCHRNTHTGENVWSCRGTMQPKPYKMMLACSFFMKPEIDFTVSWYVWWILLLSPRSNFTLQLIFGLVWSPACNLFIPFMTPHRKLHQAVKDVAYIQHLYIQNGYLFLISVEHKWAAAAECCCHGDVRLDEWQCNRELLFLIGLLWENSVYLSLSSFHELQFIIKWWGMFWLSHKLFFLIVFSQTYVNIYVFMAFHWESHW